MTTLYRFAALSLLAYTASTLTSITKQLSVLRVLVEHPPTGPRPWIFPEFHGNQPLAHDPMADPIYRANWDQVQRERRFAFEPGDFHKTPDTSSPASPAATTEPSVPPVSTEGVGRSVPRSGVIGAVEPSLRDQILQHHISKTSLPTEAGSSEAGSPGLADPEHDHDPVLVDCGRGCPYCEATLSFATRKQEIINAGYEAICAPSLLYPIADCSQHPHIRGAKTLPTQALPTRHNGCGYIHRIGAPCPQRPPLHHHVDSPTRHCWPGCPAFLMKDRTR